MSRLILSPCLFNLYAEYIKQNAGLGEAQAGIKIAGKSINNRYADDTTLMAGASPGDLPLPRAPVDEPLDLTPAFRQQQLGWGCPSTPQHLCWVRGKPSSTLTPPGEGLREDTRPPALRQGRAALKPHRP